MQAHHVVIEIYVLLSIVNAFLFVTTGIYQEGEPTSSLRSPFTGFPLGSDFPELDSEGLIENMTNPTNSTGGIIEWVQDAISDFTAIIDILLEFVQFFTAGYIIELLSGLGFPAVYLYFITVPLGLYVMYMTFVMITNRLGN